MLENALTRLAIYALPILLTLTLPLAFKAWMANRLGDSTPKQEGRLSWDPMVHADIIGTLIMPMVCLLSWSPLFFGWGKPLLLNWGKFKHRAQFCLIELSSVLAEFSLALFWMILNKILLGYTTGILLDVCQAGVRTAVLFCAFSLLPFPPLPMGNVVLRYLPYQTVEKLSPYLQYSNFILLGLLIIGVLSPVIQAIMALEMVLLSALTFFL